MPLPSMPSVSAGTTTEKTVKNLMGAYRELCRVFETFMPYIGSENIPFLVTEDTVIRSDRGETEIKGPLLVMKDIQPIIRLQLGYNKETAQFTFQLVDEDGNNTVHLSDTGQLQMSGKPLFSMHDQNGTLRLQQGYDSIAGIFIFSLFNALGIKTVGIDSNGNATFTGTITGGLIRTAAEGNGRIELTGSGLTSYNESDQKEGIAIETGDWGFSRLLMCAAGLIMGGFEYNSLGEFTLFTDNGVNMNISPDGPNNKFNGSWNFAGASIDYLKNSDGEEYVTGTSGFTGTKTIGTETLTFVDGLLQS